MNESDNSLLCQFCGNGPEIEDVAGQLHAEVDDASDKTITAHHRCMQYASALSQYKCDEFGGFDISEVEKEIRRGKKLSCHICKSSKGKKSKGACCGCAVKSCRKTFHFPCAYDDQEAVTKRLVVTKNNAGQKEKFVLYRVFCSKEHADSFRRTLKEELRRQKDRKKLDNSQDSSQSFHNISGEHVSLNETVLINSPGALTRERSSSPESQSSLQLDGEDVASTPLADSSKRQRKDRRRSGSVPKKAGRPKSRVSQPPSCSMIEELSHSAKRGQTGRGVSAAGDDASSPSTRQFHILSDADSGALSAPVLVHTTPRSESAENLSPNIPVNVTPRKKSDENKSYDCFVQIDNILATPDKGVMSPNSKENSSTHHKHSTPKETSESSPFRLPLPSPAKSAPDVVERQNSSSGTPVKISQLVVATTTESNSTRDLSSPRQQVNPVSPGRFPLQPSPVKSGEISQFLTACPSPRNSFPFAQLRGQSVSPGKTNTSLTGNSTAVGKLPREKDTTPTRNSPRSQRNVSMSGKEGKKGKSASHRTRDTGDADCNSTEEEESSPHADGDASCEQNHRKRKASRIIDSDSCVVPVSKKATTRQLNGNTDTSEASILLIPSNMEDFAQLQPLVEEMASEELKVDSNSFCVWQQASAMHALPPELLLFFMLDLVKELENGSSGELLNLLFDGESLPARLNNYLIQAQIFQNLRDEETKKEIQQAIFEGIQRSVKTLPMVQTLRLNGQDLFTMAIDFHLCSDSQKMLAYLQAYKGLFWWKENTEIVSTPISPVDQRLAAASEALTLKVWLTKVNPVTEISVFPQDDYLLDKDTLERSSELLCLVQSVRENIAQVTTIAAEATTPEGQELNSAMQVVPLLVFHPVDFVVLNFQLYFRKVCQEFFSLRGLSRFLALVPLCNLPEHTRMEKISSLLKGEGKEQQHEICVCTAFCPRAHPTSLLLLEISSASHDVAEKEATETPSKKQNKSAANVTTTLPKKRGRPRRM